jgi:hypothetical protein
MSIAHSRRFLVLAVTFAALIVAALALAGASAASGHATPVAQSTMAVVD